MWSNETVVRSLFEGYKNRELNQSEDKEEDQFGDIWKRADTTWKSISDKQSELGSNVWKPQSACNYTTKGIVNTL